MQIAKVKKTFRSLDNGGTWAQIDVNSGFSGTLITGPNSNVYHFIISADHISMVRFHCQGSPQEPRILFQDDALVSTATGVYRAVNAIVDANGGLYVAAHWGGPGPDISVFVV